MPRQRRKLSKTGTYHIMLRRNERKSIFPEKECEVVKPDPKDDPKDKDIGRW